ncbi:hypothetical protein Tco_0072266 [Tanacetum coccineum]
MNLLEDSGVMKLSQQKNLSFEEVKEEFDKLVKQVESFAPINFEATKASLKRFAMKSPSIATYKIIKQGEKGLYQIVREDGTDTVYINFGAMLKDISRDDLTELYRIVMNRYGLGWTEDELGKVSKELLALVKRLQLKWFSVNHGHAPFWWPKDLILSVKWLNRMDRYLRDILGKDMYYPFTRFFRLPH